MKDNIFFEVSKKEANSLLEFIQRNNEPCKDCNKDIDCEIYKRGICISKNMDNIYSRLVKYVD